MDFKISQVSAIISTKENQINLKKQQNKIEVKQILKKYSKSLEVSDFPFYRFSLIFKNTNSLFFFYILFLCFNLIIPFYIGVLVRKNNKYATLYREETKLIIQNNYKSTEKECSDYLLKEHKYVVKKIEIYTDEPFNRKKKEWIYKKIENIGNRKGVRHLFWGMKKVDGIWEGNNQMGKLLMELREEYLKEGKNE